MSIESSAVTALPPRQSGTLSTQMTVAYKVLKNQLDQQKNIVALVENAETVGAQSLKSSGAGSRINILV